MLVTIPNYAGINLTQFPDKCPFCHKSITPNFLYGYINSNDDILELLFSCPNEVCKKTFIGYFDSNGLYLEKTTQGNLTGKTFSEQINSVSPNF